MALAQLVVLHALAFAPLRWMPRARGGEAVVRMGGDEAELRAILDGDHKPPSGKLRKKLSKGNGMLALIGTYNKQWPSIQFAKGEYNARELDEIDYVTGQYRMGGAVAVAVEVGKDACDMDDLGAAVAEQARAKGEFPGPCPVMMLGEVNDEVCIARAKQAGCEAVSIDVEAVGEARAAELVATATSLGLESFVIAAASADAVSAAAKLGTPLVCARGSMDDAGAVATAFPDGCVRIAHAPVSDVREAWSMRDAGFNAVFLGDEMLQQSTIERVEVQSIFKAMRAKGSSKYGKGTGLGRGEGAKEILGTIAV